MLIGRYVDTSRERLFQFNEEEEKEKRIAIPSEVRVSNDEHFHRRCNY